MTQSTTQTKENWRRNFAGGLWHGAFLAMGMSMTRPTTVIAAFIALLTHSTLWVGGFSTVLLVAQALPQIFAARWIEPQKRKMPYLLGAIYLRAMSWGVLAWMIFRIGDSRPQVLAWTLIIMLTIFYAGGGLGNIPYTDIIGKVIPPGRRGAFFGGRGALAAPLSVAAAFGAQKILARVPYPDNYALLFGLAALTLAVASAGFWIIREPPSEEATGRPLPWRQYWEHLMQGSRHLKMLVSVQVLTGFCLMAMPFYVVYAQNKLAAPDSAVGWFLLAQVSGEVVFNLLWARLVDWRGSRQMLLVCASLSFATPLLALLLGRWGWQPFALVFALMGGTLGGRSVGFQSALLEIAPPAKRATYAGLDAVLSLPVAFFSLLAGWFLKFGTYETLFIVTAALIALGVFSTIRWMQQSDLQEAL